MNWNWKGEQTNKIATWNSCCHRWTSQPPSRGCHTSPTTSATTILSFHTQEMASMPFSVSFTAHSPGFAQTKAAHHHSWPSSPYPSMAFLVPSTKSSFGASNSAFLRTGFSLCSSEIPRVSLKSRFSGGVYARAATEKSLYDYTVKVYVFVNNFPSHPASLVCLFLGIFWIFHL